ncbi:MAG: MATE family efflux transporter [Chitinophagales bacterium]|nr:MATE family efflux transporter [Chitinophagaceae bacterium]MCB9065967.1 MATE family efflux transporter [Chitinophagales bacterium]
MQLSISNRDIIKLAAPIALAMLIPQISFMTDTVFLGRLGEQELAVNGMAGIFYMILAMVGHGLTSGIQVQLSRRAGENNYTGVARTFTNGVMLCLLFGLAIMSVSVFLAPILFEMTLHDSVNAKLSAQFLEVRAMGIPFLMLTQLANAFYIATGQSKYLIHGSIVGNLVNIVLDYGLIFGKLGLPEMGLVGAALASVIGEVAFGITMFSIFYIKKMQVKFPIFSTRKFDLQLAKRSLIISSPLILQFVFSIGGWQVFFIFVEHLGTRELAASQILRSVIGIAGIGLWSLASACNTMAGNVMGQGKQRLVIPVAIRISKLAVIYALGLCILLNLFAYEFLALYRNEHELIEFAIPSLRIISISSIIMGVATVLFNAVIGTGNTRANFIIEVICVGSYLVYCYIAIERMHLSLTWAWASEFVYWGSLVLISYLYLRSGRWKGKAV